MTEVPHQYKPGGYGHGMMHCIWCKGTERENAVVAPGHCATRALNDPHYNKPEPIPLSFTKYRVESLRTESPNFAYAALLDVESTAPEILALADDRKVVKLNRLLHAAMGMSNEANEFLDHMRGVLFYGKALDETNLKEETGDMLFFIALALTALDSEFEVEMDRNLRKLRARYPSKFDTESYTNRNLDAERAVLEAGTPGVPVPPLPASSDPTD